MPWALRISWLAASLAMATAAACAGGGCTRDGSRPDGLPASGDTQAMQPQAMQRLRAHVLARHPHDPRAFTQGLEWYKGRLYETTGLYGQSSVRRIELETGVVEGRGDLPTEVFGEGFTRIGHFLIQLTWREGRAIVWDLMTLAPIKEYKYQGEGWGLCLDDKRLIMSNGTARLSFRDPETFAETGGIDVTREGQALGNLNELECVDGQVYANVWQTENLVRIDPTTGKVTAWIDATGLLAPGERVGTDVMNGIARIDDSDRFLVTGKNWPVVFEVEFVPE